MEISTITTNQPTTADSLLPNGLTRSESYSVLITIGLLLIFCLAAWYCYKKPSVVGLALSLGAIGGILHELAQSGGKLVFFQKREDGIFLGSLGGMLLGALAGVLSVKAIATSGQPPQMTELSYDVFLAGLGLKGVVEAAAGTPVKPATTPNKPPDNPAKPPDNPPKPPENPNQPAGG